jgi:hypothetical protein
MDYQIQCATSSDAEGLADVFMRSFVDSFTNILFPKTEDVRQWWVKAIAHDLLYSKENNIIILKVVDQTEKDQDQPIISFAKWHFPPATTMPLAPDIITEKPEKVDESVWPPSCDAKLCDEFFRHLEEQRRDLLRGRPHFCSCSTYILLSH